MGIGDLAQSPIPSFIFNHNKKRIINKNYIITFNKNKT